MQFLYESRLINYQSQRVSLRGANLSHAGLVGAYLEWADLGGTDLREANLSGAVLSGADLSGASEWTDDQLGAARTLEGAMMPDAQILRSDSNPEGPTFEEWRKDREGGKEDTGNA